MTLFLPCATEAAAQHEPGATTAAGSGCPAMIWVPGREAAPFSDVLTGGWELLQQGIGWPGASHVDLEQTQPLLFPRPQKASFALPGEKLLKDLPACLCYEVLMHEFCPAVKTREGWVCAPVVIGNLIHDIRETVAA